MNHTTKLQVFLESLGYSTTSLILLLLGHVLQNLNAPTTILLTILSVFSIFIIRLIVEYLINHCDSLHKFLIGNCYIGGTWLNAGFVNGKKMFGILTISYLNSIIRIDGVQLDDNFTIIATWHSSVTHFHENKLTYLYSVDKRDEESQNEINGTSSIYFKPIGNTGKCLDRFDGYYIDHISSQQKISFDGIRCSDNTTINTNNRTELKKSFINHFGEHNVC